MRITNQSHTKLVVLFVLIITISCVAVINYAERNMSLLENLRILMRYREIESSIISNSFLTMSIAIISLGTIAFSIVIGMIQSLINEISYQSYSKRVLKNWSIKTKYLMLMIISFSQILIYIFFDIQDFPITFSAIFILDFLIVIIIVYSLFTSLFNDFNIYSILERNHSSLIRLYILIKKHQKFIETREKVLANEKSIFFNDLFKKYILQSINKSAKIRDSLVMEYREQTTSMTEELAFIYRNSCKRSDLQFSKTTLTYVTKLVKHRIDAFWSDSMHHSELLDMLGIFEKYDSFIEKNLIPIYTSSSNFGSHNDIKKIANEEFLEILMYGKSLKYQDYDGYNLTFRIMFSMFIENITNQVINGYTGAINDYSNSMVKLINDFSYDDFKVFYNQISKENLYLAELLFKKNESISYIFLTDVQLMIFEKSISNFERESFNDCIEGFFNLLQISTINVKSIQEPASLQRINSNWFDSVKLSSVSNRLVVIFSERYANLIESSDSQSEMLEILRVISRSVFNNIKLLAISSNFDKMIKYSFCDLVSRISEILLTYIQKDNNESLNLYDENLHLFTYFASFYKSDNRHGYYDLYEKFENLLIKSMNVKCARKNTFTEYISFTKQVYSNTKMSSYSYRSFANLIWLPLLVNDEEILELVLNTIDVELEIMEIEGLLRDFENETREYDRYGQSHRHDKFASLKKIKKEDIAVLTTKISDIINKKKYEKVLENQTPQE